MVGVKTGTATVEIIVDGSQNAKTYPLYNLVTSLLDILKNSMSFTKIRVYPCLAQQPGNGTGLDIHSLMKLMGNEIVVHMQHNFIQS